MSLAAWNPGPSFVEAEAGPDDKINFFKSDCADQGATGHPMELVAVAAPGCAAGGSGSGQLGAAAALAEPWEDEELDELLDMAPGDADLWWAGRGTRGRQTPC